MYTPPINKPPLPPVLHQQVQKIFTRFQVTNPPAQIKRHLDLRTTKWIPTDDGLDKLYISFAIFGIYIYILNCGKSLKITLHHTKNQLLEATWRRLCQNGGRNLGMSSFRCRERGNISVPPKVRSRKETSTHPSAGNWEWDMLLSRKVFIFLSFNCRAISRRFF